MTVAVVKHMIEENDVVALRAPVGPWPAGTTGTAVSMYDDAALVEISEGEPPGRTIDMIDVSFTQLELVWSGRTGWKPDGSLSGRDGAAKRSTTSEQIQQ